jgi:hypothetical protein
VPFFISIPHTVVLAELTHFITSNQGMVLFPGAYLLPWNSTPHLLSKLIRHFVPHAGKIVIPAVTDYWAFIE